MKLLPVLLLALATTAASAADPEMQRCRAIADNAARLACYDALAAAPTPPAAAAGLTIPKPADFGFEQKAIQQAIEAIDSRIPGLFEGWGPKTFIRLENGQVWQVADGSRAVIDKRDVKVRIRRGALGSFILEVEGRNATARVERVE